MQSIRFQIGRETVTRRSTTGGVSAAGAALLEVAGLVPVNLSAQAGGKKPLAGSLGS